MRLILCNNRSLFVMLGDAKHPLDFYLRSFFHQRCEHLLGYTVSTDFTNWTNTYK